MSAGLNISFSSIAPNAKAATITNSASGQLLYRIKTHERYRTRIEKVVPGSEAGFQALAELNWKMETVRLIYRGWQEMSMNKFVQERPVWLKCQIIQQFVAVDGRIYTWKGVTSKLCDDSESVVVLTHRQTHGIFHKKRKFNMDIEHSCVRILDDIVVSFLISRYLGFRDSGG